MHGGEIIRCGNQSIDLLKQTEFSNKIGNVHMKSKNKSILNIKRKMNVDEGHKLKVIYAVVHFI